MKRDIILVDNFYRDPMKVREYALQRLRTRSYTPYPEASKLVWLTTGFTEAHECPFKSSEDLIRKLEAITGEKIDRKVWRASYPCDEAGRPTIPDDELHARTESGEFSPKWNCSFHFKARQGQKLGTGVHNHSSGDGWSNVLDNGWTGLVYLNPDTPVDSGLRLWRNAYDDNFRRFTPPEEWILEDSVGSVFNRLVLVRGIKPHSGADGFSDVIEEGRLFQTFFFRIRHNAPKTFDPVDVL